MMPSFSPKKNKGLCKPRGRPETRRIAVSQTGSVRGEMPEVELHSLFSDKLHTSIILGAKILLRKSTWPVQRKLD